MPVASLVFALVVGLWAAYLLPQWVRRRETLGQSRTDDRHSERLRVLSRRARPVRAAAGPSTRPLLVGTRVELAPPAGPPVRAGSRALGRPKPLPAATGLAVDADRPDGRHTDRHADRHADPAGAAAVSGASAVAVRRRAVVLLALVSAVLLSWTAVLVPAVAAPGWVAVPATVLLAADVLALRAAARRRARRALAVRRRQVVERPVERADVAPAAPARTVRPAARVAGSSARSAATASGRAGVPRPVRAPAPVVAARPEWADRRWEDETGEIVGIERPNPLAADDGWVPVAVPQPTYMSKPVVERPKPRPWTPERDFGDDLDLDAVLARRRAVNG